MVDKPWIRFYFRGRGYVREAPVDESRPFAQVGPEAVVAVGTSKAVQRAKLLSLW